jgi:hypothetical protein
VREYDLTSYTGSTDGLCPASQVSHCDCDEGQAVIIVCAPDKSACLPQNGVCEPEVDCGWHQCGFEPEDEFCASLAEEVAAADENLTGPTACVRDIDCAAPELCVRRIYNMMFCADPETP